MRLVVAALAGAAGCLSARAMDLDDVKPPRDIVDGQVTIGSRTLQLPPGHWVYVDHQEVVVTGGPQEHYRAIQDIDYLLQIEDGKLVASVRLGLLRSDLWHPTWDFPCMAAGRMTIYRQDRESPPGHPDCLFIGARLERNFGSWLEGYSALATTWLRQMGTRLPGTTISVGLLRFSTNTFGTIWVLAPAEDFDSDAAAISWAESLRTALRPMFEHRSNSARMPALPTPEVAGDPVSASGARKGSP